MHQVNTVGAVILAAGTASRMGKPKQLLPLRNKVILEHVIHHTLNENFSEIITVIGHEALRIQQTIAVDDSRFRWLVNENYLSGQSSSLKLGINSLQKHQHIMVFLGDLPFIAAQTIRTIYDKGLQIANGRESCKKSFFTVRPTYEGISGHPVFFGNIDRDFFKQLQGDIGAKAMMGKIPFKRKISVVDRGIALDIDTPNDYAKAIQHFEY